jgi:hypothetical protein
LSCVLFLSICCFHFEAGQDFTFFLFAELGCGLERIFAAGVVMDVEMFGAAFVSLGCPEDTETRDFSPLLVR